MTAKLSLNSAGRGPRPEGFADWRARLDREQIAPVIAVAGSRGKTSVLRAVESILREGGYRFASWTDRGVEIEGERQRGELGPWSRALTRLAAGGLDVALQEVDWATIQAAGAPGAMYPVVAVANLCANSEACLVSPGMALATKALARIRSNVAPSGLLILNADDFAVSDDHADGGANRFLVGMNPDTPVLGRHLKRGGDACWVGGGALRMQEHNKLKTLLDVRMLGWTGNGTIPFAVHNALMAAAIARGCGLPHDLIAFGLSAHDARPETMPGSFNVFNAGSSSVVVDRPMPPWFLRLSLRAIASLGEGRQIHVAGPMETVSTDDLFEVGRLLGRNGGAMIVHSSWTADRNSLFRQGASGNSVPPLFIQTIDERTAVELGLGMLRSDDVMLVLAENAQPVVRLLDRRFGRPGARRETAGAA